MVPLKKKVGSFGSPLQTQFREFKTLWKPGFTKIAMFNKTCFCMEGHKYKDRFCLERKKETWLDFSLFFASVLSLCTTCSEAKNRPPLFSTALRSEIIVKKLGQIFFPFLRFYFTARDL